MPMVSPEGRELERQHRAKMAAPELVAALRKVTANLRSALATIDGEFGPLDDERELEEAGVLDAEALLKRIDEGGDRG